MCIYIYIYIYIEREREREREASLMSQTVKNPSAMQETGFHHWVGKIPWRRAWEPIPVFLPGESHG